MDPADPIERILCCNVLASEHTHRDSIFRHPVYSYEEALPWPPKNWQELCCWHCCHRCPSTPVPLPNAYDRRKDVYHVFGVFCSLPCAKAYLMEHAAFSAGDRTMLLHAMATRFFGHGGEATQPAPPRHRLTMFGGDLSIEAFRSEHQFLGTTMSPPLISTPEVYERCVAPVADALFKPQPRSVPPPAAASGLFGSFVRQKRAAVEDPRQQAGDGRGVPGTLSVFMRRKTAA